MTYEIAYAREMRTCVMLRMVVILIQSRILEENKMSFYTHKPDIYCKGEYIVQTEPKTRPERISGTKMWCRPHTACTT